MPQNYTVIAGDSLTKIAARFYGTGVKADVIVKANPKLNGRVLSLELLPTIYVGDTLIIPDLAERDILTNKDPESVAAAGQSDISILIDGDRFTIWETGEIVRSFDTIADTFTLTAPWDPGNTINRDIFKPFSYKPFSLYVGGERVMSGTIVTHAPEAAANKTEIVISGYSLPGILADVNLPPTMYPFETDGLTLQQIAENIATPFGITVKFLTDAGPVFKDGDKIDIEPTQTIYGFLIDLARQRGLVISSDVQGAMIFQGTTTEQATETIRAGREPFVKGGANYNGQMRFSEITALGTEVISGAGASGSIEDKTMLDAKISRPKVIKPTDTNAGSLQAAAAAQYGRDLASATEYIVTVLGWRRPSDSQLWQDNTKLIYQNPGNMVYTETEMLIRTAKFIKGPDTEITELTLVFPEAYSGEIRSSFPWD